MAGGAELVNWRNSWWYSPKRYTSVIFESQELLNEDLVTLGFEIACICLVAGFELVAVEVEQAPLYILL